MKYFWKIVHLYFHFDGKIFWSNLYQIWISNNLKKDFHLNRSRKQNICKLCIPAKSTVTIVFLDTCLSFQDVKLKTWENLQKRPFFHYFLELWLIRRIRNSHWERILVATLSAAESGEAADLNLGEKANNCQSLMTMYSGSM